MRAFGDALILALLALFGPPFVFFCWFSVLKFFLWLAYIPVHLEVAL